MSSAAGRAWVVLLLGAVSCATPSAAPRLTRPEGAARYRISIESDEGRGPKRAVADATVITRADGTDLVELESVRIGPVGSEGDEVALEPEVRAAFGGDARKLGRFVVGPDFDPGGVVPEGVPEPVLGVVMDLATVLLVQSAEFGSQHLARAGDERAFEGFEARWRHAPALLDARITCSGGTLRLAELRENVAVLSWEPDPMVLSLLRRGPGDSRLLLDGLEDVVIEARCDPASGRLLGGRSVHDVLDMSLHMGWSSESLPERGAERPSSGMRLRIERSIVLEPLGPGS